MLGTTAHTLDQNECRDATSARLRESTISPYAHCIHVSTSIRVSEETKAKLDSLKREDETFDQLLQRLADDTEPIEIGAWDGETADRAREAVDRSRRSVGR